MPKILDSQLKETVRSLGSTLGDMIRAQLGDEWLQRIETIRLDGRQSYQGDSDCSDKLKTLFSELEDEQLLVVGRAFSQFLNLANIAEQEFNSANHDQDSIQELFNHLDKDNVSAETFEKAVNQLSTLIHKHSELAQCLRQIHQTSLSDIERDKIRTRIADLVAQAWHTEEIRTVRPTPVDEARWGFSVVENSLWEAVPDFIRELSAKFEAKYDLALPLDAAPVKISSWMGGDRDGNPFVTSKVTQQVLLLARKRAAKLFAQDVDMLQVELSMSDCDDTIRAQVGDELEPYRALLRPLLTTLTNTKNGIAEFLNGESVDGSKGIASKEELTRHLGMGDYANWSEEDKQAFLLKELSSKRPLFPTKWQPSADVQEVIDTCKVVAKHSEEGFGIYIISMASLPSDVLSVHLLLREFGVTWPMPVAPLFETLDDLNAASGVIDALMNIDWYRGYIQGHQYVMIGYSDSAKDAGAMAAGWAQYESQEALVAVAEKFGVELTLFHGRGGTIGRGGLPAHAAILSQPPGSLSGGFRVTEQGETIRYKFGMPQLAQRSLSLYASAILEALISPPPAPKQEWRDLITEVAANARDNYRNTVRHDENFVPYFRVATPEQELGKLPLGSRPAKRKPSGGIESLRAIPWIFAWAQTRLVLPSWLGAMKSVQTAIDAGKRPLIDDMLQNWPFFHSRFSMLDMVFGKADPRISAEYDKRLVPEELRHLGDALRDELNMSMSLLLDVLQQKEVMESDPKGNESMNIRAGYLQPLHFLQIELLERIRAKGDEADPTLERAMMVTIAGIAVGMRNTG